MYGAVPNKMGALERVKFVNEDFRDLLNNSTSEGSEDNGYLVILPRHLIV
jgi:hypothetical protein